MAQNSKMQKTQMSVFVQNPKNSEMEIFAFCVITFEPIIIYIRYAPQNDPLNLSVVKDEHTNGKKWPEMVVKRPFMSQFHFESEYILLWGNPVPSLDQIFLLQGQGLSEPRRFSYSCTQLQLN